MTPALQYVITAIVFALLGFFLGFFSHDFIKKNTLMSEDSGKNLVLLVVTILWGISMVVSVVNPNYNVPIEVHALMGGIVGYFFYKPKRPEQ